MANIKRVNLCYCNFITMKKFSWFFACLFSLAATAQEKLVIMGKPPDLYVVHTVGDGESLQTISNQFGQSVTRLSSYNGKTAASVLTKGEQIKIPVTEYNLLRVKGDEDNSAPLYHIIKKGDNLYRLSQANKVTVAKLKEWNNLKTDIVKDGQAIIVAFMVNAKVSTVKKEVATPDVTTVETAKIKHEEITPPVKKDIVKPMPKTTDATINPPPVVVPETKKVVNKPPDNVPVKKEEPSDYIPKEGDEGYFAAAYTEHGKELEKQFHSGDAAIFKTISGWTDHKYYVLINDVAPETIVRITAPNNKSICAKVLGPLQETKGASGLLLRMSNSAASTLGIADTKFTVTVTYFE